FLSKEEFAQKYKLEKDVIKEFHSLEFDKKALKSKSNFPLRIGDRDLLISRSRIVERGENDFSFVGNVEGTKFGKAIISIRNENIVGTITTDIAQYRIVTFGTNDYFIAEFDNSNTESCPTEGKNYYPGESIVDKTSEGSTKKAVATNNPATEMTTSSNSCNMRLIVVYTPAIDAIVSDIRNMINHHILEANTFLEDADVFETWELAYAGLTDYEEEYIPDGDGRFTDSKL
ncbi:MAG: hypothetical protein ACOC3T_05225, partial [Bacteroidota bacterium]